MDALGLCFQVDCSQNTHRQNDYHVQITLLYLHDIGATLSYEIKHVLLSIGFIYQNARSISGEKLRCIIQRAMDIIHVYMSMRYSYPPLLYLGILG